MSLDKNNEVMPEDLTPAQQLQWEIEHLDPTQPLPEDTAQRMLNNYSEALRSEFEMSIAVEPDNVPEYTHKFFREHVSIAAAQIVHLAVNAESDTVKFSASKFIVNAGMAEAMLEGDPIKDLLKQLQGNDKKPEGATTGTEHLAPITELSKEVQK